MTVWRRGQHNGGKREFISLVLVVSLILVYCTSAKAAEFQFWYGNKGRISDAIQSLCNEYNASQSVHNVKCVGQGGYEIAMQKAIAAYRANKHPAVIQFFDAGTLDVLMSGVTIPVSDLMQRAGYDVDWEDYLPAAYNYYAAKDGRLYSLPFNVSTLVFYINQDKLNAAGLDEVPETWEDFEANLKQLKAKGEGCPYTFWAHPWWHLEQFSAIHGIPIATKHNGYDGLEPQYIFPSTLHRRRMADLKRWYDEGLAIPKQMLPSANMTKAFASGKCVFFIGSTGAYGDVKNGARANGFDVSVHRVPHYKETRFHNTLIGGAALWVLKGFDGDVYKAVADFFQFLRRPEKQIQFSQKTGYLPVTKQARMLLANEALLDTHDFAAAKLGMESLSGEGNDNTRGIRLGSYTRLRAIWIEEMEKVFGSGMSVEKALYRTKRRGDKLLKRFRRMYYGEDMP